jgi:hypothetical protein
MDALGGGYLVREAPIPLFTAGVRVAPAWRFSPPPAFVATEAFPRLDEQPVRARSAYSSRCRHFFASGRLHSRRNSLHWPGEGRRVPGPRIVTLEHNEPEPNPRPRLGCGNNPKTRVSLSAS